MRLTVRNGVAGLVLMGVAAGVGCSRSPSVQAQAMDAYKKGDYQTALPLFKKWAADPKYFVNNLPPKEVMAYIVDCQQKLKAPGALPAPSAVAGGGAGNGGSASPGRGGNGASSPGGSALPPIPGTSAPPIDPNAILASQAGPDIPTGADRIPHPPVKPGDVLAMSIKEIANFEYDPVAGGDIPADVKQLDGATVRVKGFMIPLTQAEDIKEFALVPSLVSCCFGQPPGVQHVFTCKLPEGRAVQYTVDEIEVEGTLHVNVKREDGYTSSIFDVSVSSVKTVE